MTDHLPDEPLEQPTTRCARAPEVWTLTAPILDLRWRAGPLAPATTRPTPTRPRSINVWPWRSSMRTSRSARGSLKNSTTGRRRLWPTQSFRRELVDRAVREDPEAARAEILSLRRMLERELDTLRGYINQLRPSLGEADASLDDALRR